MAHLNTLTTTETAALLARIQELEHEVRVLRTDPVFGCLTPAALKHALSNVVGPVDVIFIDGDKWHVMNSVLGYEPHSNLLGLCLRTAGRNLASADVFGRYGGDEFVAVLPAGDGAGFLRRLQSAMRLTNRWLSMADREALRSHTGNLVEGISFTIAMVTDAYNVDDAIVQAHELVEDMKKGGSSDDRATEGSARGQVAVEAAR